MPLKEHKKESLLTYQIQTINKLKVNKQMINQQIKWQMQITDSVRNKNDNKYVHES